MPTLPTLTVTDAQATRMIRAWGTVEAYQQWLQEQIIQYVLQKEISEFDRQYIADRTARETLAKSELKSAAIPPVVK